ncbi:VOC family protein, partial [Streptomyces sp. NRRL WC-3549]|uniref:VOC family protein n=1 Tax=Streptomyces sp. NRRL WC-3549 TaxID=1463925 RepID=UPI002D219A98
MTLHWKLVIDAGDPHAQADFWAETLGYEVEDNSPLIGELLDAGQVPEAAVVES